LNQFKFFVTHIQDLTNQLSSLKPRRQFNISTQQRAEYLQIESDSKELQAQSVNQQLSIIILIELVMSDNIILPESF
jgi:hypothetical protein